MDYHKNIEDMQNQYDSPSYEKGQMQLKSGFHLFYLFPITYVFSVYFIFIGSCIVESYDNANWIFAPVVICAIGNIVAAILFGKPENRILMLNAMVLIKYGCIPFYLIGGIGIAVMGLLTFIPVPFMIFAGPMAVMLGSIMGWLVLAFSAPYVISYLRLSYKAKIHNVVTVVLCSILQFFFCVDVFSVMFLAWKEHKWKKITIFLLILISLAVVILVISVIIGIFKLIGNA